MVFKYNNEELDGKTQLVLQVLKKNDGSATTNEVKTLTGLDNDKIRRRFDKLDRAGLLESKEKVKFRGHLRQWYTVLNDDGWKVADRLEIGNRIEGMTMGEEIERLEQKIGRVKEDNRNLNFKVEELEHQLETVFEYFDRKGVRLPTNN